jgi:hypothetical protein
MYTVRYNSNPNVPIEVNHYGSLLFLIDVSERKFDTQYDALHFWSDCTSPITSIQEIVPECTKEVLEALRTV